MSERNLDAYYYHFFGTGSDAIDSILESVARAGKAYHHTGEWGPSGIGDNTPSDWIQEAANIAAERERSLYNDLCHAIIDLDHGDIKSGRHRVFLAAKALSTHEHNEGES